jgi:hypothetical protein
LDWFERFSSGLKLLALRFWVQNWRERMPALRFSCKFVGFVILVFTVTALLLKKAFKKAFLTAATKQNKLRLLNCGCCAL